MSKTRWQLTQAELERATGWPRKTLLEWEAAGMPRTGTGHDKRYDLPAVLKWWRARVMAQANAEQREADALDRYRRIRADREAVKLARERGASIDSRQAAAWWADRITEARTALQGLGQAVAPAIVGLDAPAIARLIDDRCRAICEDLARKTEAALTDEETAEG